MAAKPDDSDVAFEWGKNPAVSDNFSVFNIDRGKASSRRNHMFLLLIRNLALHCQKAARPPQIPNPLSIFYVFLIG
jgi:hypothetical protein